MSDTCRLFPLFGDPWPSCLLPAHRVQDELFCCGIISSGPKEKTFYVIKMQECRKEVCPFLILESPRPLSPPWGPWTSINLRIDSSSSVQFQSLSCAWVFVTPWTSPCQASLTITHSWSLLKLESVMPSSHLILSRSPLLLPSVFPSIRVFSNESVLCIGWPNNGASFSASVLQDWLS